MADYDVTLSVGLDATAVTNTATGLNNEIENIFKKRSGKTTTVGFESLLNTLDKLSTKATNISQKMQELGTKQIPTTAYTEVQQQIDKVNKELVRANDRKHKFLATGGKKGSKTFKSIEYDINQASHKLQYLEEDLQDLVDNGKAFTLGSNTAEYDALVQQLNQVNNQTIITRERLQNLNEVSLHPIRDAFANLGRAILSGVSGLARLGANVVKFSASLPVKALRTTASLLSTCAKNAAKFASNTIISSIKKLGNAIGGIGKSSNGTDKLLKKGLSMLLRYGIGVRSLYFLFRKIRKAITEGFEDIAKVHEPFNIAVSNIMTAFYQLKGSMSAAFAPIVEYVEPILVHFMNVISEVISQIGMLAAALTGKEFVKAVPVQQDYADSLTTTAEKEKDARKALQDQKKEMKKNQKEQKKLQKEVKKTISSFDDLNILSDNKDNDTDDDDFDFDTDVDIPETPKVSYMTQPISDAFKDLADKLKAMFRNADFTDLGRLLGEKLRDALNRIPWDKIKDTLRKIAKSIATFLNGFLEVPGLFEAIGRTLAEALNSAFEFLNEFAKQFHWASLGQAIGKGLTSALQTIDWWLIFDTLRNWGTGLAQAINGFVQETDFTLVGETIAKGITGIFVFLFKFAQELDWSAIGTAIKDAILGFANQIDWPAIYLTFIEYGRGIGTAIQEAINDPAVWTAIFTTLTNSLNAVLLLFFNFISAINWADMGTNIGTGMNNAIESFNWDLLKDTLVTAINGVFDLWYNWVTTFDFYKFGTHIGTTLSGAVNDIDWKEGGASVAQSINGLYEAVNGFVETTDWGAVGAAIIDAIAGFFDELDWGEISTFCSNKIKAFFDLLTGAFKEVNWKELPGQITTAISDFLTEFDWDGVAKSAGALVRAAFEALAAVGGELWNALKAAWKSVMEGGLEGIIEALKGIGDWIVTHIVNPFIEGFKSAFDIGSPAKTMYEWGGYILEGVLQGIINAIVGIADWIKTHIVDPFIEGFKSAFGLDGEESSLVSLGVSLFEGFKTGIGNVMSSIGEWIRTTILEPFLTAFKSLFGLDGEESVLVSIGADLIGGLKSGLENAVSGMKDWIGDHITGPITGFFSSLFGIGDDGISSIFSGFGGNLIEGLKNGLVGAIDGVGTWIDDNVTGPVLGFFKDLFGIGSPSTIFESYGGFLIEGLKNGLLNSVKNVGTWVDNHVTGPILGAFKNLLGINSPSTVFKEYGGYLMEGLEQGVEDNEDLPKNALSGAQSKMKDVFGAVNELLAWANIGSTLMEIGLKAGILVKTPSIITAVETLEADMRKVFSNNYSAWKATAVVLLNEFVSGLNNKKTDLLTAADEIISTLSYRFNSGNWWQLGVNIIEGIYNGVLYNSGKLYALAWNTAAEMYNSAARALGVASPSKKFAWIGKMVDEGWGGGIEDNKDIPIDTAKSVAEDIVDTANDVDPTVTLDTQLNNTTQVLADVLDKYSTTIVNSFTDLISTLNKMADLPNSLAISQGRVVPYSALNTSSSRYSQTDRQLEELSGKLDTLIDTRITQSDIIDIVRRYLSWSIGDEQIARHANAGNAKLDRRLHPVRGGA